VKLRCLCLGLHFLGVSRYLKKNIFYWQISCIGKNGQYVYFLPLGIIKWHVKWTSNFLCESQINVTYSHCTRFIWYGKGITWNTKCKFDVLCHSLYWRTLRKDEFWSTHSKIQKLFLFMDTILITCLSMRKYCYYLRVIIVFSFYGFSKIISTKDKFYLRNDRH
jgi:hypothetical protein